MQPEGGEEGTLSNPTLSRPTLWKRTGDNVLHPYTVVAVSSNNSYVKVLLVVLVPDHNGGLPKQTNACILITHMVYL
jgi:hypothetical protein